MYARPMVRLPAHLQGTSAGEERLPRAVLAQHQRARVLASVIPIFARRGYQATTVDDLLAAGKVGVGNFYSLFEGKEDCFLAAFDWSSTGARKRSDGAYRNAKTWPEGAVLGLRELLICVCEEPLAAREALRREGSGRPAGLSCRFFRSTVPPRRPSRPH